MSTNVDHMIQEPNQYLCAYALASRSPALVTEPRLVLRLVFDSELLTSHISLNYNTVTARFLAPATGSSY